MVSIEMLNENQKKAVLTSSQYVRIIAGAGSGKTRVLTMRIAHLIEQCHVWPNKILAITFTNKAANEMKERIRQMLPEQGNAVFISTIHSLCVRILREDIPAMGMPRNFTVMDADDQRSILKEAYKEFGLDKQTYTFGSMLDYIANNPSAGLSLQQYRNSMPSESVRMAIAIVIVIPIACAYPFFQKYFISGLTIGAVKG